MKNKTTVGYEIKLFMPDGNPDGIRLVEKSNWTGHGLVCPRVRFPTAKVNREEFDRTGIYILLSDEEFPTVYIGQGDIVRTRLEQHYMKKDFWTSLVIFTSKDNSLNTAHVKYLEANLVQLADEAKRCELDNNNTPKPPSLSESEEAVMDAFLSEMMLIFPIIGINIFMKAAKQEKNTDLLYIKQPTYNVDVKGFESEKGFVVLQGSKARAEEVASITDRIKNHRSRLIEKGILIEKDDSLFFTQDFVFGSPSTAASIVMGRNANGLTEWKNKAGISLKKVQKLRIREQA